MSLSITELKSKILRPNAKADVKKSEPAKEASGDKKSLLYASLIGLGVVGAASFAIIKTKNKAKAKKAAQEMKNVAEEQARVLSEKAKKAKEEELIRCFEQNAKEKALKEAEFKAKQEAEVAAKKEAEIRAAQAAEKLESKIKYSETIKKLDDITTLHNDKELNLDLPYKGIRSQLATYTGYPSQKEIGKTTSIMQGFVSVLEDAETKGISVSKEDLKRLITESMTPQNKVQRLKNKVTECRDLKKGEFYDEIRKFEEEKILPEGVSKWPLSVAIDNGLYNFDNYLHRVENKNTYLQDVLNILEETPIKEKQKTSEYLKNLLTVHSQKSQEAKKVFESQIKSKLTYVDEIKETGEKLTKEEMQTLADEFNKTFNTDKYTSDYSLEYLSEIWKNKYISGYTMKLPPKIEQSLLSQFERANPSALYKQQPTTFEHQPLYRWMEISNIDDFLKQFQKEGCEYSYNKLQSCSVSPSRGELTTRLSDWNPGNNVKFVYHPKEAVSKAAVMGEGKYGNTETIYPAGQKFKFIGKIKKEISNADYPKEEPFDSFYRWEIHLQEA